MKRTLLTLGTVAAVAAPIAGVVACGASPKKVNVEEFKGTLGDHKLKIMTLGDSVAHGDYTFQMSGSGTGFMPLLDGPARAASYQDYIFDELQRDGLMDENDRPDYRISASGLRSGELAQWIKTGTYLEGQKADNPDYATPGSADQIHVDYHRHPYTYGAGKKTWWDDGLKDSKGAQIDAAHTDVDDKQRDDKTMDQHIKESDVVLITIGGNDILKDIMVMGTPFPNLGTIDWNAKITQMIGALHMSSIYKLPGIKAIIDQLPTVIPEIKKAIGSLKTQISGVISGSVKITDIIQQAMAKFGPLVASLAGLPDSERLAFDKWFLGDGHKMLITVDEAKLKESLAKFSANIKSMSEDILAKNPNAKVIFTGYPSPMMHFPKIFRNLAMPIYGQIAKLTETYTETNENVYFAPSSLKNWETDDPTDIYDNILVDPHPTLEGQGVMAKDIIKVIDGIYGTKAKITDEEIRTKTAEEVKDHSAVAPTMSVEERNKEIAAGTYKYPYQTAPDVNSRGDLDYAYGVKPLPLEEVAHAKVYFGSRIGEFLIDAITDSIQLNPDVKNNGDQSVPYKGALTLSDFTKSWGDNYIDYVNANPDKRFIQPLSPDFKKEVFGRFEGSIQRFIKVFITKLEGTIATNDKVTKIKELLATLK